MFLRQSQTLKQYGFSHNDQTGCLVSFQKENTCEQWFNPPYDLSEYALFPNQLVYALSHKVIWRKVYFLPPQLTPIQSHQQIIRILKQELPIELHDLHFDYQIRPLANALRIAIFAVRKSFIPNFAQNAILDCELHCIARALHYLTNTPLENLEKYYYPFQDKFFQFQVNGLKISTTNFENSELLHYQTDSTYLTALGAALWNTSELT